MFYLKYIKIQARALHNTQLLEVNKFVRVKYTSCALCDDDVL